MSRKLWPSLVLLAAGAALLVGAGFARPAGSEAAAADAKKGGTLRLSSVVDLDSMDPARASYVHSWTIEYATCAKLFSFPDELGAAGRAVVPEVARGAATISNDGRTYTFELKRTFRFDTGAQVTARSFADAFNRDANPKNESVALLYVHDIVGADAVIRGKAKTISGVRVLGRYRLQIRLTKPLGDFTARLTMPFFCPITHDMAKTSTAVEQPAGSGPYYVAERVVNTRTVLRRNPFYRGGRPANVDEIVYTINESREACQLGTEQDEIDHCVFFGIPKPAYATLAQKYGVNRPGGQFFVNQRVDTWYLAFNHDRPAFKGRGQIPLKKAINYAIDRRALARAAGDFSGTADDQMLPAALGRPGRFYPLEGDPVAAQSWYKRAASKPRSLVVYAVNDGTGVSLASEVSRSLRQIGIEADVKYFDQSALADRAGARGAPYDVILGFWTPDYPDPASYFDPLLNGRNIRGTDNLDYSYLDDPGVNARIAAAKKLSGTARRRAWADLDGDLMRDDPPWAPYLHTTRVEFVSRSFGCYLYHPIYGVDYAAACKK